MAWTAGGSKTVRVLGWVIPMLATLMTPSGLAPGTSNRRHAGVKRQVIVSVPDRKFVVMENGAVLRVFPVAVGADATPSPAGEFEIVTRLTEPTYYHSGVVIPPGADNPLGPRWVGFNKKGYGIHGTNAPGSIGKAASHGCIRMRNPDIVQFFAMVNVGDTVEIHGQRDEEIAEIFGGEVDETTVAVAHAVKYRVGRWAVGSTDKFTGERYATGNHSNRSHRGNGVLAGHRAAGGGVHFRRSLPPVLCTANGAGKSRVQAVGRRRLVMLFLKYLLMTVGIGMMVVSAGILTYDFMLELRYRRAMASDGTVPLPAPPQIRWRTAAAFVMLAWAPILIALSIVVVPSGMAGVRVSQTQGTLAGTLYPGVHFDSAAAGAMLSCSTHATSCSRPDRSKTARTPQTRRNHSMCRPRKDSHSAWRLPSVSA